MCEDPGLKAREDFHSDDKARKQFLALASQDTLGARKRTKAACSQASDLRFFDLSFHEQFSQERKESGPDLLEWERTEKQQ